MLRSTKITIVYLLSLLVFTLSAAVLRTVALLTNLDGGRIYFENTQLVTFSGIIVGVFALASIVYPFLVKKELKPAISFENSQTYVSSALAGVAFFLTGIELLGNLLICISKTAYAGGNAQISNIILALVSALAIISSVTFFLNVFFEKRENNLRAAFCLCCALYLALYAGHLFFSDELPMNAPNKGVDQLAYLALSIFFLFETRISLSRSKWGLYAAFGFIASIMAFYSAIPSLIFYFLRGEAISYSLSESVLTLALGIYTVCRLTLVVTSVRDEISPVTQAITDMADMRSAKIAESDAPQGVITLAEEAGDSKNETGDNYEIDFQSLLTNSKEEQQGDQSI